MPKVQRHPIKIRMPPRSPTWTDLRLTLESRVPYPMSPLNRTSLTMPPTLGMVRLRITRGRVCMTRSTTLRPMWMRVVSPTPVRALLPTMESSMLMHHRAMAIHQEYQSKLELNQGINSVHHLPTFWMVTWIPTLSRSSRRSQPSRSYIVTRVKLVWRSSWTTLLPTTTFRMEDLRVSLLVLRLCCCMPRTQQARQWMLRQDHSSQMIDHLRLHLPKLVSWYPLGPLLLREESLEVRMMRGTSSTTCILIRGLIRQLERSVVAMKVLILEVFAIPEIKLEPISNSMKIP